MEFGDYNLYKIVINYQDRLKEMGYDTSDDKFEPLINGFIKIANSMINENMKEKLNKNFDGVLHGLFRNNFIIYRNSEKVLDYMDEKYKKEYGLENIAKLDAKTKKYDYIENKEEREKMNKYYDFLLNLTNKKNNMLLKKTDIIAVKKFMGSFIKKCDISDKFNNGELTELEQIILIEILNYKGK